MHVHEFQHDGNGMRKRYDRRNVDRFGKGKCVSHDARRISLLICMGGAGKKGEACVNVRDRLNELFELLRLS